MTADSCRMKGIEDVGIIELVLDARLLWMGDDLVLVRVEIC